MVGEGVPASNVEVREVLLPILDDMPDMDGLPPGFCLVLREIDRYLAGRMHSPRSHGRRGADAAGRQVAAGLLSGKVVS